MRIVVAMGLKNEIVFLEWRVQWGLGRKCLGFVCFEGVYGVSFQVFSRQLIQWMGRRKLVSIAPIFSRLRSFFFAG
ncbi:hypothetical protein ES332_D11G273600v1 [Gossypium tomentosum]|uniref:Uncharacterized protein n=1 Tax=Gossypium tomentosum TaxID=34277 RepID=A0A5D2IT25_GOSTO|nr:hypothetical protein ES332_D11G273600v1 [Gossypium tomentosum]